ncbi:MAG: hypothetical protein H6818_02330 [Phycisphaerales bacterium]|nr:hypothetical protein [Phycisphaerales bacterium]MCB9863151.1 hypothetical protein [Phycisphaerales bacterium]
MTQNVAGKHWISKILLTGTIAAGFSIAAIAQPVESPIPKTRNLEKIEKLVQSGQLSMVSAVKLAEEHTKGLAFFAECSVRPGPFPPVADESSSKRMAPDDSERLEYQITCVIDRNPVVVTIDGKEKKVVAPPKTPPTPKPDPAPAPPSGK